LYDSRYQVRRQRGARLRILTFNILANQITKKLQKRNGSFSLRIEDFNQMKNMLHSCPAIIIKKSGHFTFQKILPALSVCPM
jgi:hypothetical protein